MPPFRGSARDAADYLARAHAPQLPLFEAVASRRVNLLWLGDPAGAWPTAQMDRLKMPTVVLIADDDGQSRPPGEWACARRARWWARAAIVHAAGGEPEHYRAAVAGALATGRLLLVETDSAHGEAWHAFLAPHVGGLFIRTRDGLPHPCPPARKDIN